MADWLSKPWIEKAIHCFYDKDAVQPKFARAQIIQFNKIPSKESASAEALLSDKWMYAKAIFTTQAIQEFEKSSSNIRELSLCDIKGGLIFLNDYRVLPHVDYAKGVWEHLLIINKFTFKGSEKSSQFGSELINSAAHSPFQVRIKKHFKLKQLVQLLQSDSKQRRLSLAENKAYNEKAITDSFVDRHQFVFIPDEQQKLLDEIPEWRKDYCPPSTLDSSNSLNTSLPSNQEVQDDSSLSPHSYEANKSNDPNDSHFSIKELPPDHEEFGLSDSYDHDGSFIKIPDNSPSSVGSLQKSAASGSSFKDALKDPLGPHSSGEFSHSKRRASLRNVMGGNETVNSSSSTGSLQKSTSSSSTCSFKDALEDPPSQHNSGDSSHSQHRASLGNGNSSNKKKKKGEKMEGDEKDFDEDLSLLGGRMHSKQNSTATFFSPVGKDTIPSESTTQPSRSPYVTLLDILENLEHESDLLACTSKTAGKRRFGNVVDEQEEVDDWTKATEQDKRRRRSSVESALVKQIKARDEWLSRCSDVETSFNDSSVSGGNLDSRKMESSEEKELVPRQVGEKKQCIKSYANGSEKDKFHLFVRPEFENFHERFKNSLVNFTSGSSQESEFEDVDFPVDDDDDDAECLIKSRRDVILSNETSWSQLEKCVKTSSDDTERVERSCNVSTCNSQCVITSDTCLGKSKDICSIRESDSFEFAVEDETRGREGEITTSQGWEQEQEKDPILSKEQSSDENASSRKAETLEGSFLVSPEDERTVEANVLQASRRGTCKIQNVDERATYVQPLESTSNKIVTENKDQELNKESRKETCECMRTSKSGDLSTTDVFTCQVCRESSLPVAESFPNSVSGERSSSGQESDESFSILKNASILDLTPGGFKPEFTSTARSGEKASAPAVKHLEGATKILTTKKKRVSFGKSVIYEDKHILGSSFGSGLKPSSQVIASSCYSDLSDDDSLVPCTQQDDDELMSVKDPLQILKDMSFPKPKVFPKNYNFKASGYTDTGDNAGTLQPHGLNTGDSSQLPTEGNSGVNVLQRQSNDDDSRYPTNDLDDASRRPAAGSNDVLRYQNRDGDFHRVPADNDYDDLQDSPVSDVDDMILCSDESEEFILSPLAVAKDSVLQCIKNDTDNKIYKDLVMGSDDSPGYTTSSSPKTVAKQNILRCIQQEGNTYVGGDVRKVRSQSKQPSTSPSEFADSSRREKSLQFTLSDTQLDQVFKSSCLEEKENSSFLRCMRGKNVNEQKSSKQAQHKPLVTISTTERRPDSIPCSSFYRTKCNNNSRKQTSADFTQSQEGSKENLTSLPENKIEEVECLMYVSGKGLETSALCVKLDSHELSNIPDENNKGKKGINISKDMETSCRRTRLVKESTKLSGSETEDEKEERTVDNQKKPSKMPQECISVAMETQNTLNRPHNLAKDSRISDHLDIKGARNVNKIVGMETHVLPSSSTNLVGREGGSKRKRSQDDDDNIIKAVKKLTVEDPDPWTTSGQGFTKKSNFNNNKENYAKVVNERPSGVDSSQSFTEFSCDDHVLYSQQDPLVLEFPSLSQNTDYTPSQELPSSPILLPSPPHEISTPEVLGTVGLRSQSAANEKGVRSTDTEVLSSRFNTSDRIVEESSLMSEEHELSSPKFVSLPSYQIPTTKDTNHLPISNKQENTTNDTLKGKNTLLILSDSEDEENENSFCWFTTEPCAR